jgi:adenylate cyclase class IV
MRNAEIKARSTEENHKNIRSVLVKMNADFAGKDHQIDTYFAVPNGRLKLREGDIENFLVQYSRDDKSGPKLSNVILTPVSSEIRTALKNSLIKSIGVLQVVEQHLLT